MERFLHFLHFCICKQCHLLPNGPDWPNRILFLWGYIALDQVQVGQYPPSGNYVRTFTFDWSSWLFKRARFHKPAARPCTQQCRFLGAMGFLLFPTFMHVCEDHVLSNDRAKYAEMPTAGVCFRESPTFGQVYAYLGHITVRSAELLTQSTTVNAFAARKAQVRFMPGSTTVQCMQGLSLLKQSKAA